MIFRFIHVFFPPQATSDAEESDDESDKKAKKAKKVLLQNAINYAPSICTVIYMMILIFIAGKEVQKVIEQRQGRQ